MVPGENFPVSLHGQLGAVGSFQSWESWLSPGILKAAITFGHLFKIMPLADFTFSLLMKNILCHHPIRMNPPGMGREV